MDCRVWEEPGGGLRVTTFPPSLTVEQRSAACQKLLDGNFVHPASTFVDTDTSLLPSWPPQRAARWKWRLQGGQVVVRPTVPDFVSGRQALQQEIAAATTVADLKATLLKLVGP